MPEDTTPSVAPLAEINLGPSKFEQFLENNHRLLIVLLALLVIASAAYIVIRGVEKSREQTAGAELSKAKTVAALQEVSNKHANTNAAASAKILLADMQASEGKSDEAIQTLQDFIAKHGDHPAKPTASAKLAAQLMSLGKTAEASATFQGIADDPNARYIAPYALICLGDIAKAGGDPAKAESFFNQVKTKFPESSFADIATERLATVKATPPVEVEPPAPEAPKAATEEKAPAPAAAPAPASAPASAAKKTDKKPASKPAQKPKKSTQKTQKPKN